MREWVAKHGAEKDTFVCVAWVVESGAGQAENKGGPPQHTFLISLHLGQGPRFCSFNPKPLDNMAYRGVRHQEMLFIKNRSMDLRSWLLG